MPPVASDEEKEKMSSEKFLTYLPKDALKNLHVLTLETFKRSYPDQKEVDLEGFVTQNLFKLMNHVIKVNMNSVEE